MKSRFLSSATIMPSPPPTAEEAQGRRAPIPMIGTMQRDTTPEQRALHGRMKRDMKRAARNVRYQRLQEQEARDKP